MIKYPYFSPPLEGGAGGGASPESTPHPNPPPQGGREYILVLGKGGQVGGALAAALGNKALAAGREEVDFLATHFISDVEHFVGGQALSAVINASAYTKVDHAEGDGRDEAFRTNAVAVEKLAGWCKKKGLPLIHYSTDYVFDGSGETPWHEDDKPHPLNAYGQSKLLGEEAIAQQGGQHVILRTSWVYDATGKNFFTTIRRLLNEKETLNVISDQIGAPTYAAHLAQATLAFLSPLPLREGPGVGFSQNPPPSLTLPLKGGGNNNIYHLCSGGQTSWHGFAQAIFAQEKARNPNLTCKKIQPIPTSDYPLPAPRPLNSRLDCSKAAALGVTLPSWEEGLKECFSLCHPRA